MSTDQIPDDIWEAARALRSAVNWNSNSSVEHIARALLSERQKATEAAVSFVLGHYESGPMPFAPTPIDPDTWWSKVQIVPHDPDKLLPRSRAHFNARIARWQELAAIHSQSRQPIPSQADRDAGSDEHLPVATGSNSSEVA